MEPESVAAALTWTGEETVELLVGEQMVTVRLVELGVQLLVPLVELTVTYIVDLNVPEPSLACTVRRCVPVDRVIEVSMLFVLSFV